MILIVDNRIKRQQDFISDNPDLERLLTDEDLVHIYKGDELAKFRVKVLNNEIDFKIYKLVALHYTYIEAFEGQIVEQCNKSNTSLVYFSGRFNFHYSSKVNNISILQMNVEDFYSNSLVNFLQHYSESKQMELLRLQFGENWILSSCLQIRYNLHDWFCYSEEDSKDLYYRSLISDSDIETLIKIKPDFGNEIKRCVESSYVRDEERLSNQLAILEEIIESLI